MGNSDRLADGFSNIIKNACESMPKGGTLKIEAKKTFDKEKKEFVEIKFIDGGCGIPEEKLDRAFDPFFSTKDMSAGLGLSITRGIIELHSGTITLESRCAKPLPTATAQEEPPEPTGTTVTVRLPVRESV
jgi:two-component system sporulation sensor kinase A